MNQWTLAGNEFEPRAVEQSVGSGKTEQGRLDFSMKSPRKPTKFR